jgi:hypothetical protein
MTWIAVAHFGLRDALIFFNFSEKVSPPEFRQSAVDKG